MGSTVVSRDLDRRIGNYESSEREILCQHVVWPLCGIDSRSRFDSNVQRSCQYQRRIRDAAFEPFLQLNWARGGLAVAITCVDLSSQLQGKPETDTANVSRVSRHEASDVAAPTTRAFLWHLVCLLPSTNM